MPISTRRTAYAACVALTLLVAGPSVAGRPGDLDPAFGSNGIVQTAADFAGSLPPVILRQPDGKLIAVGQIEFNRLVLARYNFDGTLDATFGAGGIATSTIGTNASAAVLQPDGKILVAGAGMEQSMEGINNPLQLTRFLADGSIDAQFGNGGTIFYPPPNGQFGQTFSALSLMLEPDGRSVVSGVSSYVSICCTPASNCFPGGGSFIALLRFNLDGSIDPSYGNGGVACTSLTQAGGVAAAQPDGAVVVTGHGCSGNSCIQDVIASRYDASGVLDVSFGNSGSAHVSVTPPPQFANVFYSINIDAIVVQPDGKLLLGLSGPNGQAIVVATRLNADGSVDAQFAGGKGAFAAIGDVSPATAHLPPPGGGPTHLALQSDGKLVLASRPWDASLAAVRFGSARFNADGTLDPGYGNSGVVLGPLVSPISTLVQADNKLVMTGQDYAEIQFVIARFLSAPSTDLGIVTSANPVAPGQNVTLTATVAAGAAPGTVQFRDGAFGIAGCAVVPLVASSGNSVATCSTSSLTLGSHTILADYSGDAANPAGQSPLLIQVVDTPGTDVAVEYLYPAWNHYFITSLPNEIAELDNGTISGWQRTGETFAVYPGGAPLSTTQCRFFSGSTFAPKSSHFYSPYAFECRVVYYSESDVWSFEGNVTPVRLADAQGGCPAGARPLYRLYNNGLGAAPNHRYTTRFDIRASMIAQGWSPEGAGTIGVIACVPGN